MVHTLLLEERQAASADLTACSFSVRTRMLGKTIRDAVRSKGNVEKGAVRLPKILVLTWRAHARRQDGADTAMLCLFVLGVDGSSSDHPSGAGPYRGFLRGSQHTLLLSMVPR